MSDRFPAQIWIGGKVSNVERLYPDDKDDTTTILQGLISSLNEDGGSHEFGDLAIPINCTQDALVMYLDDESLLTLKQDQAVNGEFQETENFCVDNDISFDRHSDCYCEYDAEKVLWRPGMSSPVVQYVDSKGHEIIDGDAVRQALALLESALPDAPDAPDVFKAIRYLSDCCLQLPPKLESFKVEGLTFIRS